MQHLYAAVAITGVGQQRDAMVLGSRLAQYAKLRLIWLETFAVIHCDHELQ
jgi:hypothetical protein